MAIRAKQAVDRAGGEGQVLVFDDVTSRQIELDFRGTAADVVERIPERAASATDAHEEADAETQPGATRGRGRPRLGVVAREVTLLPRHWEWLADQPGGASVALRKLVEEARRDVDGQDRRRRARESAYRFMSAIAGNRAGFEEATRALFAGDRRRFAALIAPWPAGVRGHVRKLADAAFAAHGGDNERVRKTS